MTVVSPTAIDVMVLLASQATLTLIRSLSDEQWATAEQIVAATGYSEFVVTAELAGMRTAGVLETCGELYRLDVATVKEHFALMTADLPGV